MKMLIFVLASMVTVSCAQKMVGQNCDQTKSEKYWVCDKVPSGR